MPARRALGLVAVDLSQSLGTPNILRDHVSNSLVYFTIAGHGPILVSQRLPPGAALKYLRKRSKLRFDGETRVPITNCGGPPNRRPQGDTARIRAQPGKILMGSSGFDDDPGQLAARG